MRRANDVLFGAEIKKSNILKHLSKCFASKTLALIIILIMVIYSFKLAIYILPSWKQKKRSAKYYAFYIHDDYKGAEDADQYIRCDGRRKGC